MGWFSADEIIANNNMSTHDTVQTVALGVLAIVALIYGVLKIFNAHHRNQAERAANRAMHMQSITTGQ